MNMEIRRGGRLLGAVAAAVLAGACGERAAHPDAETTSTRAGAPAGPEQQSLELRRVGYDRGTPGAPVAVLEFSDFGCPYCSVFARETFPVLHEEFIETGKVHWTYIPFVMGTFPNGAEAAGAAECAAEQGEEAFWAMHDRLYARQREWKSSGEPNALFRRLAAELRLDVERFSTCYAERRGVGRTRAGNLMAAQLGVRATPTFFINGFRVQGALPAEQFRLILRAAAGE